MTHDEGRGGDNRTRNRPDDAGERQLLKVEEAAEILHVSVWAVRRWVGEHRLPSIKLGRCVRIDRRDLDAFIESGKVPADTPAPGEHRD